MCWKSIWNFSFFFFKLLLNWMTTDVEIEWVYSRSFISISIGLICNFRGAYFDSRQRAAQCVCPTLYNHRKLGKGVCIGNASSSGEIFIGSFCKWCANDATELLSRKKWFVQLILNMHSELCTTTFSINKFVCKTSIRIAHVVPLNSVFFSLLLMLRLEAIKNLPIGFVVRSHWHSSRTV